MVKEIIKVYPHQASHGGLFTGIYLSGYPGQSCNVVQNIYLIAESLVKNILNLKMQIICDSAGTKIKLIRKF